MDGTLAAAILAVGTLLGGVINASVMAWINWRKAKHELSLSEQEVGRQQKQDTLDLYRELLTRKDDQINEMREESRKEAEELKRERDEAKHRYEELWQEHTDLSRKYERMSARLDSYEDALRKAKITFRPWNPEGGGTGLHPQIPPGGK